MKLRGSNENWNQQEIVVYYHRVGKLCYHFLVWCLWTGITGEVMSYQTGYTLHWLMVGRVGCWGLCVKMVSGNIHRFPLHLNRMNMLDLEWQYLYWPRPFWVMNKISFHNWPLRSLWYLKGNKAANLANPKKCLVVIAKLIFAMKLWPTFCNVKKFNLS